MEDFDNYINSEWYQNNTIPDDWSSWNSFTYLVEETNIRLKKILEDDQDQDQCSLFYKISTNVEKLNNEGLEPLTKYIEQINNINTIQEYMKVLANFHTLGLNAIFHINVGPDIKESNMNRLSLNQGPLNLPDRDYYILDSFSEKRTLYIKHLTDVLKDVFISEQLLSLETKIAQLHRTKVEIRDSDETYYKFTLKSFIKDISEHFEIYFKELNMSSVDCLLIDNPSFFRGIIAIIADDLNLSKLYLKYRLLVETSSMLSEENEKIFFDFYGTVLTGQTVQKPRWKRMIKMTESFMGQLLGQKYCSQYFNENCKSEVLTMISYIEKELEKSLIRNDWMSHETKQKGLLKLSTFKKKIGYPDTWPNFSDLKFKENESFLENVFIASRFNYKKEFLDIVDKQVDKNKWHINPQDINAYYDPSQNEIVFPAGILQEPFYKTGSLTQNYGGIGSVIAHEIIHGYDNNGRKFDHNGLLKDWWSQEDAENFNKRTIILKEQYDNYKIHDLHVNGSLTLGENLADYGGVTLSFRALINNYDINIFDKKEFFASWARIWRCLMKKDRAIQLLSIDPHAPMKYRTACVRNIPEFFEVYNIKEDEPIFLDESKRIKLW